MPPDREQLNLWLERSFLAMPDAVLLADDDRRYVFANPAACRLFSVDFEQLIGRRIEEFAPPPPQYDVEAEWRRFLANGEQAGEFPLRRQDGTELWLEYRATANVAPGVHLSVLRDVSDRVRARTERLELSRRSEEARSTLEALIAAAPVGFAVLDRELRFHLVNEHLAAIDGLPVEAHLGRTPAEILPGIPAGFAEEHGRRVLREGVPLRDVELVAETPAQPGHQRTFVEQWYPVRVAGETVGVGIVVDEVTARRRHEEFRERVIAIVSHDLRGPLTAIMVTAKLLAMGAGTPGDRDKWIQRILSSAARMQRMIELLLDWVRAVQLGGFPLRRERVDAGEVARTLCDEQAAANARCTIATSVVGDVVGWWDGGRFAQALGNLVGNACQHGTGAVEVAVQGTQDAVEVRVTNQGRPIAPEMLPRIFEPFRQGGESPAGGGLGLGLFITKEIARAHGGDVFVTSSPDGTCFTLRLPRG